MQLEMLHIEKTRPLFRPSSVVSNASYLIKILTLIPYLSTASSCDLLLPALSSTLLPFSFSLQPLFSYLLSPLLSHFHPHTTYSLSFNYVLATFRLLRKARRLHSLLTKILYPYSLTFQLSLLSANSFPTLLPSLSFLSSLLPSLTPLLFLFSLYHSLYNLF